MKCSRDSPAAPLRRSNACSDFFSRLCADEASDDELAIVAIVPHGRPGASCVGGITASMEPAMSAMSSSINALMAIDFQDVLLNIYDFKSEKLFSLSLDPVPDAYLLFKMV